MSIFIKYCKVVLGCLFISLGLNLFLVPSKLVGSGALGITSLFAYNYNFNIAALLLIINVWTLWLVYMIYDSKKIKEYLLPSLLIPLFIYLTSYVHLTLNDTIEELLIALFGAFIVGCGYSFLYKEGYKTGAINILEDMINDLNNKNSRLISRGFDFGLIVATLISFNLEQSLYSLIVIVIIRYMTTKASLGISDYKAFYIITSKDKEIRKYIMEDLHYDLTLFDAEGGFTKKKNKVVLTVIPTKDYFRLKEGIKMIDKNAFISVTDNYEVINKDLNLSNDSD